MPPVTSRAVVVAVLLLALASCRDEEARDSFQGYAEGEFLRIAAADAGWVREVPVTKGAHVAPGAPLFVLDDVSQAEAQDQARANLAQAEAQLADLLTGARPSEIASLEAQLTDAEAALRLAELTRERQRELVQSRTASQSQLDQAVATAEQTRARRDRLIADVQTALLPARHDRIDSQRAAVEAARAALAQAQFRLDQRRVASSVAGVVDDVVRRQGDWAPPNGVIISLLPDDARKVVFFVPEASRALFSPGDAVRIACTACAADIRATVSRIASAAEYTPPIIYSRETAAKLVWRIEARIGKVEGAPAPGQPVTIRRGS